jgi:hypothetical protein
MKRKVKKYDVGGMTDEEGKQGIFGGPKSSMQDEDTRFKAQASNRRSGLPSAKESTGTSYGPGSDSPAISISKEKTTVTRKKLPSNPSAKEFTGEVVKAKDLGSQSFAAPAAKKESSYGVPAALAAMSAGLGAAASNMKGMFKRSGTGSHEITPRRGVLSLDPSNADESRFADEGNPNYKRGGKVKKMASGGKAKSASARADGCAIRGKTRA